MDGVPLNFHSVPCYVGQSPVIREITDIYFAGKKELFLRQSMTDNVVITLSKKMFRIRRHHLRRLWSNSRMEQECDKHNCFFDSVFENYVNGSSHWRTRCCLHIWQAYSSCVATLRHEYTGTARPTGCIYPTGFLTWPTAILLNGGNIGPRNASHSGFTLRKGELSLSLNRWICYEIRSYKSHIREEWENFVKCHVRFQSRIFHRN